MAGAKGFWGDAFPCALLRFHTIHPPSSSPQVLRSWSSLQPPLGGGAEKHKQDIVMHLGVKTYLKCLRGFQRKHSNVGIFFFPPLNSAEPCGSGVSAGAGRRQEEGGPPLHHLHIADNIHPGFPTTYGARTSGPATGSPGSRDHFNVQTTVETRSSGGGRGAGQRLLWHSECVSSAG